MGISLLFALLLVAVWVALGALKSTPNMITYVLKPYGPNARQDVLTSHDLASFSAKVAKMNLSWMLYFDEPIEEAVLLERLRQLSPNSYNRIEVYDYATGEIFFIERLLRSEELS